MIPRKPNRIAELEAQVKTLTLEAQRLSKELVVARNNVKLNAYEAPHSLRIELQAERNRTEFWKMMYDGKEVNMKWLRQMYCKCFGHGTIKKMYDEFSLTYDVCLRCKRVVK